MIAKAQAPLAALDAPTHAAIVAGVACPDRAALAEAARVSALALWVRNRGWGSPSGAGQEPPGPESLNVLAADLPLPPGVALGLAALLEHLYLLEAAYAGHGMDAGVAEASQQD